MHEACKAVGRSMAYAPCYATFFIALILIILVSLLNTLFEINLKFNSTITNLTNKIPNNTGRISSIGFSTSFRKSVNKMERIGSNIKIKDSILYVR